ncbi:bile acid:sodium symporter [Sphingobacterium sp. lm-10]|uniref:bile acid:sodium symporter family protein n=1 Tax=Sphingobacterium sp. lm-10 TaxID=2944904 RepID=UPI002020C1AC|nr:bile acid:sodium symporter family protein [Sphingobacterium sp. lm-10]MCL7986867.1 bile acid:sodium symporter [Sphingobacterium sp. lm-10]
MKLKFDPFILFLFLSILIAYLFPNLVLINDGQLIESATSIGVALIFFFYGLKLSFQKIKDGLQNWRLHLAVQSFTFLLFPLVVIAFRPLVHTALQEQFWLSFFFLAALPSTVSSSVVMVSIAKGNIPAAIFNASISGLIGVIVTPLWMQLFLDFGEVEVLGDVYLGLIKEIILPVILGLFLQRYLGAWAAKYNNMLSKFDKAVILLIVYSSFAESFVSGIFNTIDSTYLLAVFGGTIFLFFAIWFIVDLLNKKIFKFNRADRITALFCGSKKSLTHGSVFGKFLFINSASAGLYFLPLMIFHAFQILVVTIIAQRYHKQAEEAEPLMP